jgi:hypothetical protein
MGEDAKKVLAARVQKFVIEELEMLLDLDAAEAVKWEAKVVTALNTQVRIWPEHGGPRYFTIQVSENL